MDDPNDIIRLLKNEEGLNRTDLENCVIDLTITKYKSSMFDPLNIRNFFPIDFTEEEKIVITRDITVKDKEGI